MNYSITGYLEKYYGCMMSKEDITLDEALNIAWSNAQKGLYSVIESETHAIAIYIDCDLFDEYTTDVYDLIPYEGVKNRR